MAKNTLTLSLGPFIHIHNSGISYVPCTIRAVAYLQNFRGNNNRTPSHQSTAKRRIDELLGKLVPGDIVIVSELSRIGRSIKETLDIIDKILKEKKVRIILIKQSLDLNPNKTSDITTKILVTIFSMVAELERDFISERTKEGLRARAAKGIKLGKPKGILQASMYDNDKQKIFDLYKLGVPFHKIISTHLGYGKYLSLKKYIEKRYNIKNDLTHIQKAV